MESIDEVNFGRANSSISHLLRYVTHCTIFLGILCGESQQRSSEILHKAFWPKHVHTAETVKLQLILINLPFLAITPILLLKSTFTNYDLIGVFCTGVRWLGGGGGGVGTPWVKCCQKKYPDL